VENVNERGRKRETSSLRRDDIVPAETCLVFVMDWSVRLT